MLKLLPELDAPALAESKDISERLKTELRTLGLAWSDKASKARLLGQELDGSSAIERVRNIEVDAANQQLETLQNKLDALRAAAVKHAQELLDMCRQRDDILEDLQNPKFFLSSLRCRYLATKTHVEDMRGVQRTTARLSKFTRTSRVVSQKVEQHPLLVAAGRLATNVVQGIQTSWLAQNATFHRFKGRWTRDADHCPLL